MRPSHYISAEDAADCGVHGRRKLSAIAENATDAGGGVWFGAGFRDG
jgi:hypothetical protein